MKVFVLSKAGKPLMPTTPGRARVWLKAKRARVVRRDPFTIRLRFATQEHVQPARVGIDTGSLEIVHQMRCIGRGQYQRFNGLHSEHKCWAPRKVRGFKLYELVQAKGQVGYIAGRREKGAFVIKDVISRKKLAEVTPRKLRRLARPTQGWIITRLPAPDSLRKESGASSPT